MSSQYSKWTVRQLIESINEDWGVDRAKTTLRKPELIRLREGTDLTQERGQELREPVTALCRDVELTDIHYDSEGFGEDLPGRLKHYRERGWTVFPTGVNVNRYIQGIVEAINDLDSGFSENNVASASQLPGWYKGILKFGTGHCPAIWSLRGACEPFFRKIYADHGAMEQDETLLASIDGVGFTPPGIPRKRWNQKFHIDRSSAVPDDTINLQGVLSLTDQGPGEAGTTLLLDSHRHFREYLDRRPCDLIGGGYQSINIDTYRDIIQEWSGRAPIHAKICTEPGDLLIWDNRMVHGSINGQGRRVNAYISFEPRSRVDETILRKLRECALTGAGTNHWVSNKAMFKVNKNGDGRYDRPVQSMQYTRLSERMARWTGFTEEQIQAGEHTQTDFSRNKAERIVVKDPWD